MSGRAIPVIGLAGGVGSGKSELARALGALGCVVADSDTEAKAALDRPEVRERLVEWWGEGVLDEEGRVDRKAVASIVFSNDGARRRLESVVHPLVRTSRRALIRRAAETGAPAVVIDAPLLFEAGVDRECDAVVFVEAPRAIRLARVAASRGWDAEELERRERAQLDLGEKRRRSQFVVENLGEQAALEREARSLLTKILSEAAREGWGGSI